MTFVNSSQTSPDLQALNDRISALESLLGLFGAATPAAAGTNGLVKGAAAGEQAYLLRGDRAWQNPINLPISTATTAAINNAIASLIASSPATLDTLNELAAALGNDPNFATTIINSLASKAPLVSPNFTGFTTLGDNVAIKKKLLTGITAASQGGTVSIVHELNGAKIVDVSGVIFYSAGSALPVNSRQSTAASFWATNTTDFFLTNESGNSSAILSKTFYAVIEYVA